MLGIGLVEGTFDRVDIRYLDASDGYLLYVSGYQEVTTSS